ncbi:MAG TPA: hypothetical protein VFH16_02660 [Rubrobacter sp.]|nr:hypothetical protein [Rubrobacter sp.]
MNLSTTVNSERFWERLWRSSGIIFVVFFVIAYVMYGLQPKVGGRPRRSSRFTTAKAPGY